MAKFKDLTGQKFGRLTVLHQVHGTKRTSWLCQCECGNTKVVQSNHLLYGETLSCGCLQKEVLKEIRKSHGLSDSKLYNIWNSIKMRCYNINCKEYKYYGNRGITMCEEWKNDFLNFHDWSISNGYSENLTIDRVDVNGNYEPNNCRWITWKKQANNKRNNFIVEYNGQAHTISEWAEITKLKYSTIFYRITKGWSVEKSLTSPTNTKYRTKKGNKNA